MTDEQLVENELIRCNRCGYCLSTCPTYHVEYSEGQAARGRLALLQALQDGDLSLPEATGRRDSAVAPALVEAISGCLLCGACTQACFSAVRTDDLIVWARAVLHGEHSSAGWRLLVCQLLLRPNRLTALLRLANLGRLTGLSRVLRSFSRTLNLAEQLAEPAPRRFLRDRLREIGFRPQRAGTWVLPCDPRALAVGPRVLYFIGCGTNYQLPAPGAAAMQLLARAGCEVVVCPHVCCGLPPYSYGELASTRELAGHNLKLLGDVEADYIVTDCGSCGRFLKRYPELLAEAEGLRRQAERLATKVRDFTELLSQLPLPAPIHPPAQVITYHDPCHLGRGQGLTAEPRRLLREAAGANLVELPDADWCCGGAGTYSLVHADRSGRILRRKVDNIAGTGASVLATACPACILQIRHGLRQSGLPVAVRHVAEIVAEAQGLALIS